MFALNFILFREQCVDLFNHLLYINGFYLLPMNWDNDAMARILVTQDKNVMTPADSLKLKTEITEKRFDILFVHTSGVIAEFAPEFLTL
jgi:hypothetical protein